mgnify:CR=1 FL=1
MVNINKLTSSDIDTLMTDGGICLEVDDTRVSVRKQINSNLKANGLSGASFKTFEDLRDYFKNKGKMPKKEKPVKKKRTLSAAQKIALAKGRAKMMANRKLKSKLAKGKKK